MPDLIKFFFGSDSEPIRREVVLNPTVDSDGNPIVDTVEEKSTSLSSDGSIDSTVVRPDRTYHCGDSKEIPMGGRCAICGRISCAKCFGRCRVCLRPLCLEDSRYFEMEKGVTARLCPRCFEAARRKKIILGVLSPFIEFEGGEK